MVPRRVGALAAAQEVTLWGQPEADGGTGEVTLAELLWVFLAIGVVVSVAAVILTARSVAGPVKAMTRAMRRLADGDLAADVPARDRSDEIGEMATSLNAMLDNIARLREQGLDRKAASLERQVNKVLKKASKKKG